MTNLEYLRMKIPDKDPSNPIFTNDELNFFIQLNSEVVVKPAYVQDLERKVWQIKAKMLDNTYPVRVFGNGDPENEITSGFSFDYTTGTLTFDEPQEEYYAIYVQASVINWDNVLADVYETILGDLQKLQSYSIQNVSANGGGSNYDIKRHLRFLASFYRSPMSGDL